MPGALTPTEIWTATNAGADFVKVFLPAQLGLAIFANFAVPLHRFLLWRRAVSIWKTPLSSSNSGFMP